MRLLRRCHILIAACLLGWAAVASAHEANPLLINIQEVAPQRFQAQLRVPSSVPWANQPELQWPDDCVVDARSQVQCSRPLQALQLTLHWPQYNPAITLLVRVIDTQGVQRSRVVEPDEERWFAPAAATRLGVITDYMHLGARHILGGADHLLFLVGMLLIARGWRALVLAVTGFTIGHSVSLSVAALGKVHIPVLPTEALIALSIALLAREALVDTPQSFLRRFPMLVCGLFGLLHGLGFASALGEVGLPQGEALAALLAFNIGVELGQLLFLVAVTGVVLLLGRVSPLQSISRANGQRLALRVTAYVLGCVATYWFLQRLPPIVGA